MAKNEVIKFDDLAFDDLEANATHVNWGGRIENEWQLAELGEQLVEAQDINREVILYVWKRQDPVRGKIAKLDGSTRMVHMTRHGETVKVPFADIIRIGNPE